MARIKIPRAVAEKASTRSNLNAEDRESVTTLIESGKGNQPVSAEVRALPRPYLLALLDDTRLPPNQRAVIAMQLHGMSGGDVDRDAIYDTDVSSPVEFGSVFVNLGTGAPNCELFKNGRWYPVVMQPQFLKGEGSLSRAVGLRAVLSICELIDVVYFHVSPSLFIDEGGGSRERTVLDILHQFGLRRLQTAPSEFNLKLLRAERAAGEAGRQALISGPVLMPSEYWWSRFESRALGSADLPRKGVVEPELEVAEGDRGYQGQYAHDEEAVTRLPLVRLFSLDLKCYVYADVDDVAAYEYDGEAMGRLHLPRRMLSVLDRLFNTPVESLFGDLIEGKHGGVVVLASGRPGVGKTLTAEVYAEQTGRPLYVLELGELGTHAAGVEESLRRVFARVSRWNAVLQFDECEIFLTERGDDLERSAIVGIFLRLLDYYQGILFLTTNRAEVLDHAVLSRVMLKLEYPDLDVEARAAIWRTMFAAAGLELAEEAFTDLAAAPINGRQIRNLTRLAKVLHPEGRLTLEAMREVLGYGCPPATPKSAPYEARTEPPRQQPVGI